MPAHRHGQPQRHLRQRRKNAYRRPQGRRPDSRGAHGASAQSGMGNGSESIGGGASGFYFVAEFVPGLNAAQILERDGPLPIQRAIRWAEQILQGLKYAHAKQFIHRDIKPSNLIVADMGGREVVKLTDFAVARVYHGAPFSGLSLTKALLNLASFIPPEVLFNYQEVNPLADQYSVAAVVYHLLTGA